VMSYAWYFHVSGKSSIDELLVEKGHLSKLIIICRIKLTGD